MCFAAAAASQVFSEIQSDFIFLNLFRRCAADVPPTLREPAPRMILPQHHRLIICHRCFSGLGLCD